MDQALAWVGKIAEWLGAFIPRWVILDTTESAIKFVGGKRIVVCGPGIHFWWPARTTIRSYPIARQTDRLESQTMETSDGKTFLVAGTITYRVDDIGLLVPFVHSCMTAVTDIAMLALHSVCCSLTWNELQQEQRKGTLGTKLRNAAQKDLAELGIKVLTLRLNTLAKCRVIKVSQSTSTEEN